MRYTLPREGYFPRDAEKEDLGNGDMVVRWMGRKDKPCAAVFHGKAQKPDWKHLFRSEEQREEYITSWRESLATTRADRDRRKQERQDFAHGFKVGDILSGSWGYEQTNVDFWQVTEVRGKQIIMRHLCGELVKGEEGFMQGRMVPVPDAFLTQNGDEWATLRKTPSPNGSDGKGSVKIASYLYAHEWSGNPMFCSWYG